MIWPDPIHQSTQPPTHPPNHTPTHGWGILHRFQNLQTELKYLDKLKCYRILSDSGGPPPWGVADGWMGVGVGMSVWGVSHACTHRYACMHAHTCMLNMLNMDASMLAAICNSIHVCVCVCVRVCACMWGHPPSPPDTPRHPPTHLPPSPEPQGAQNTKFQ